MRQRMPGSIVQQYELLEKLGEGGMGSVYKAHDKRLNRFVAIKVLPSARSGSPERRRRFLQEAQAASALNHPSIITIHDILEEDETQYLVMEHIAGRTLHDAIPVGGLRVSQVLHYGLQMADALSAAHAAGIVHRDFKPTNVMITNSGLVKVLDFGLAKVTDRSLLGTAASASRDGAPAPVPDPATITHGPLTVEGAILGTVNYMSPEQAEGKRVDARSDIFSFGAVLYEMITGLRAFEGVSDLATLTAVLRDEVRPIVERAPEIPVELEQLVTLCLRKRPEERWQSMREVEMTLSGLKRRSDAGALQRRGGGQISTSPVGFETQPAVQAAPSNPTAQPIAATRPRRALTALAGGTAGIVLLLVASATWWWTNHHSPSTPVPAHTETGTQTPATSPPAVAPPAADQQPPAAPPPKASSGSATSSVAPTPPATPRVAPEAVTPKPDSNPASEGIELSVGDGLPLRVALAEDVPSGAPEGQPLTFRAVDDFRVGTTVLIARGALVTGSVASEAGKKRFLGMGGKMTFQLDSAETVDGQKLKVRASPSRRSDGPATRQLDTGRYAKPKDLAAARGTDFTAYIDGDQSLTIRHSDN